MDAKTYKEKILNEFVLRYQENENCLADAFALIWAIDVYASIVAYQLHGLGHEIKFKESMCRKCEGFKIIHSASNAIKHVERKEVKFLVYRISDISEGQANSSFHAWLSTGNSTPRVSITLNWEYDPDTKKYRHIGGKEFDTAPQNYWRSVYLSEIFGPAIQAIEEESKSI